MGYTTEFEGVFKLDKKLTAAQAEYLRAFSYTRRMKRDPAITEKLPDTRRLAVGLGVGPEGGYYVGSADDGNFGQGNLFGDRPAGVVDYNNEPQGQPGLWCQWEPTEDDQGIQWNGAEKFYDYVPWLQYLVDHFLRPWGLSLSGEVSWQGEDSSDFGKIVVENNVITTRTGRKVYG